MRRLAFLLALPLFGCANFSRGVWENRGEVFARLDALVPKAEHAYGTVTGFPVALAVEATNATTAGPGRP